jgi:hypothetical protein
MFWHWFKNKFLHRLKKICPVSRYTAARCFICHHFNLIHCIIFRYKIDSNELQKTYQLNLKVMVCYEAGESCGLNVVIHNNYVMNRTSCNLTDGFLNPCKYICVIVTYKAASSSVST